MDQAQKNLVEGAVGGEDDETQVKLERGYQDGQEDTSAQETNAPVYNERPDSLKDMIPTMVDDIDLSNKDANRHKERMCNMTYTEEMNYEYNKAAKFVMSEMNIPSSGDFRKECNNLSQAMAENQNSFETLVSEPNNLHALSSTCLTGNGNGISPSDNTNMLDRKDHTNLCYNCGSVSSGSNNLNPVSLPYSDTSNESRYSQKPRSQITDKTLVTDCHEDLINLVSAHLDGKGGINWRKLLGLYNSWTYNELKLFENKVHDHHYFRHILELGDFQEYTIEQLKEDLEKMPKKNTLSEVNEWIQKFNTN